MLIYKLNTIGPKNHTPHPIFVIPCCEVKQETYLKDKISRIHPTDRGYHKIVNFHKTTHRTVYFYPKSTVSNNNNKNSFRSVGFVSLVSFPIG